MAVVPTKTPFVFIEKSFYFRIPHVRVGFKGDIKDWIYRPPEVVKVFFIVQNKSVVFKKANVSW